MAPSIYKRTLLDTLPNPDERPNLTTPTLSMANNPRSAQSPSPSPSTSLEPSAHAAAVSVERLVLDICHRERRGMAMQILTKVMKSNEDVALAIWHSCSTVAALIQEIVSIYRYLSPPILSLADSTRVCYALALLKCLASHRDTRTPFLQASEKAKETATKQKKLLVFEVDQARKLVVGNIHVLFNPKCGDIKLGQIRMFLSKADSLSRKWDSIPILLAGDFNSTPDSAIYEFLSTSELNISEHDRRHLSGMDNCQFGLYAFPSFLKFKWTNDEVRNATGYSKSEQVKHPLKLRSSYATIQGNARTRGPQGEPLATSYHSKFLGTVDYIWYSTGFGCRKVLDTLPIDTLRKIGGLPTKEMGSDHLALVAEFIFTESSELDHPDSTENSAEEETTISKKGIR